MVVPDPASDLLSAVARAGDDPSPADRRVVALARRRFGISLAPPFAGPMGADGLPVRVATAFDGPAIAAVKWRSYRCAYRGVLPDPFLDGLGVHPPVGYWTGRAAVPPSARHLLLVAGRVGEVHGFCAAGPTRDDGDGGDPERTAHVAELYVDPLAAGRGVGTELLDQTCARLVDAGFAEVSLWVIRANTAGRRFYEHRGWRPDGGEKRWRLDADDVTFDEVRYRRPLPRP